MDQLIRHNNDLGMSKFISIILLQNTRETSIQLIWYLRLLLSFATHLERSLSACELISKKDINWYFSCWMWRCLNCPTFPFKLKRQHFLHRLIFKPRSSSHISLSTPLLSAGKCQPANLFFFLYNFDFLERFLFVAQDHMMAILASQPGQ